MQLHSVEIDNYRSIDQLTITLEELSDGTMSYGLIGVNEAGKSSILKALALKEGRITPTSKDFRDKSIPIQVQFNYVLDDSEVFEYQNMLSSKLVAQAGGADDAAKRVELGRDISINYWFESDSPGKRKAEVISAVFDNYEFVDANEFVENITSRVHSSIFWTAEDKYLISAPINLTKFAETPEAISIPLKNCFVLAGITNIEEKINALGDDSTEIEELEKVLGESVTEHIRNVWPGHPIQITFKINNNLINFHVKDLEAKGKAKTADQRSDGFKQFVSFLLTVSAQNMNEELSNSILLLDEPETHLHPQAQESLLEELIRITNNKRGNVLLFATHSNYMIDKKFLNRNFKIEKLSDKTEMSQLTKGMSTYASVTYEVFNIPSSDYHNELYGKLHARYQEEDISDNQRIYITNFDSNYLAKKSKIDRPMKGKANSVTLPTYIRNCIHHPDNGDKFNRDELEKSIKILRSLF